LTAPPTDWARTSCFSTALRRADRTLSRIYDEALRPTGLTTTQYSLLSLLSRAPQPPTITEFADAQAMDRTSLTRALAPLVRAGYVTMAVGRDRRAKTIHLTEAGQAVVAEARPLWRNAQERIAAGQGLGRMEHLLEELAELTSTIRHA
jgi:DNA-binding MarR family transcriptional regulator